MMQNPLRDVTAGTHGDEWLMKRHQSNQAREIDSLREELREAKETLDAIRSGAADALVVARNGREMVYTLENADKPFRIFLEEMQEGAVTVDQKGLVVYANRRFAEFRGRTVGIRDGLLLPRSRLHGGPGGGAEFPPQRKRAR